jgi:hypothetical protein
MKTGLTSNDLVESHLSHPVIRERVDVKASRLSVSIQGSGYLVDFGPGSSPRLHKVGKNKECSCGAPYCEAIEAVRLYLRAGGLRAPDPDSLPPCPICGCRTYRDPKWDGRYTRTLGWLCEKGGLRHFLEARTLHIRQQLASNPWLIPPVPGYPGVRRDELLTNEECEAISHKVFQETGYDPTK